MKRAALDAIVWRIKERIALANANRQI